MLKSPQDQTQFFPLVRSLSIEAPKYGQRDSKILTPILPLSPKSELMFPIEFNKELIDAKSEQSDQEPNLSLIAQKSDTSNLKFLDKN